MLILASGSPRRRELLTAAGIPHQVIPASIPEEARPGETAEDLVVRLAAAKAHAVGAPADSVVLGADTVVCVDDEIFGKPRDAVHAAEMLRRLSGRDHLVITGICLLKGDHCVTDLAKTRVYFLRMSASEIDQYIETGEPFDKAGAYAIQGFASKFVLGLEGCYHNVVGLPVSLVYSYLKTL